MGSRKKDPRIKKLQDEGKTVWSYSRLNTFNQCKLQYHLSYNKRVENKQNIYSYMGGVIHDAIEAFQCNGVDDKGNRLDIVNDNDMDIILSENTDFIKNKYQAGLIEAEMLGLKFPNEIIEKSWKLCMEDWINNFKKIDRKMITEKLIVFEVVNDIWIQGYIDVLMGNKDGTVDIMDWKTSSKFTGKELIKAGRQLLLYELGVESNFGRKTTNRQWYMFKLINLCKKQKNGKIKKSVFSRHKWVKENKKQFENVLRKFGIDEFEIPIYINRAIADNNIDIFPEEIKQQYWIEDGYVSYDSTPEKIQELKDYIKNTVNNILSLDKTKDEDWEIDEINPKDAFFCNNLCGVRGSCYRYKEYLDKYSDTF